MRFVKLDIVDVMKAVRDYTKKRSYPEKEARMVSRIMDMYMNTPYVYNDVIVYIRSDFCADVTKAGMHEVCKLGKKTIMLRTKNGENLPQVMNITERTIASILDLKKDPDNNLIRELLEINNISFVYTTGIYEFIHQLYLEGCMYEEGITRAYESLNKLHREVINGK